ncbi:MAG: Short-chain dehydrogenase/reductase SDR, partial [uncultured Thermomicrobiales bacterium]
GDHPEEAGRPGAGDHRRHVRDRPGDGADGGQPGRPPGVGGAERGSAATLVRRTRGPGRASDDRRRRRRPRGGRPADRGGGRGRLRRLRHLGQQRRGLDLRQARGRPNRGHAAVVRDQLLGRRLRFPRGGQGAEAARRRPDHRRQRVVGAGDPAPGHLQRQQARGQGVHRCPADGVGGGTSAGLRDVDRAELDQHPLRRARQELDGRRGGDPAAGLRAGVGGEGDPPRRDPSQARDGRRRWRQDARRLRLSRPTRDRQGDGGRLRGRTTRRRLAPAPRHQRSRSSGRGTRRARRLRRPHHRDQPLHLGRPAPRLHRRPRRRPRGRGRRLAAIDERPSRARRM